MTKRPVSNLAASVHQRLLNKALETGRPFNELLQHFAIERFLYRLSKSPKAKKFILKGALMFKVWKAPLFRPTMDIDLLGKLSNNVDEIATIMKNVCVQGVEPDGLVFDASSVTGDRIAEAAQYGGVRVRFHGALGNARVTIQIDVWFGDVIVPSVEKVEYPVLLSAPAPRLAGYSKESMIAEKFETMVNLGVLNSRLKDFFDIWFLSQHFNFDGRVLATAIAKTFSTRGTKIPPKSDTVIKTIAQEPGKTAQWQAFIRKSRLENVPERFGDVVAVISDFLNPIADCLVAGLPFPGSWKPFGPWKRRST